MPLYGEIRQLRIAFLTATLIAWGSVLGGWAQPSPDALKELYAVFGVDLPPADVVLLMDASGSMLGKYDTARAAVVQFVKTLTEKENLHLRVFASVVSVPLDAPGTEAGRRVESYLPRSPLPGQGTDIGMAIQKGIEFLERPGSASVQVLFLVTDGFHQPSTTSPYSRDFTADADWRNLRARAQRLCQRANVLVYGFGIGNQTDIQILQQLFPAQNVELVVGNVNEVAAFLQQVRERIRRAQLSEAVRNDLERGELSVTLQPSRVNSTQMNFTVAAVIRNAYRLPVIVEKVLVHTPQRIPLSWQSTLNSPRELRAGESLRIDLHATLRVPDRRFQLGKTRQQYRAGYRVVPTGRFRHETLLQPLQRAEVIPRAAVATLPVELTVRQGIAWGTVIGMLIALISALVAWRTLPFVTRHSSLQLNLTDWPAGVDPPLREWRLRAGTTRTFGTDSRDEYLPNLSPSHITVNFTADGQVQVFDAQTGQLPLEIHHRMFHFQTADYAFRGQIEQQESWNIKPIFFLATAFIALIVAIVLQVYT